MHMKEIYCKVVQSPLISSQGTRRGSNSFISNQLLFFTLQTRHKQGALVEIVPLPSAGQHGGVTVDWPRPRASLVPHEWLHCPGKIGRRAGGRGWKPGGGRGL